MTEKKAEKELGGSALCRSLTVFSGLQNGSFLPYEHIVYMRSYTEYLVLSVG